MPTVFLAGDLFTAEHLDALAHGCNCAGAMGKGIAVEFRRRHPKMYQEYRLRCRKGSFQTGDVFFWEASIPAVFNLGTQRTWRTKAELPHIRTAITRMIALAQSRGMTRVGLPRVGAGLGGMHWPDVRSVLEELGAETEVELGVFEEYVPELPTPE